MFPGPGAHVYYNDDGEPLGWDYPGEPDPGDFADALAELDDDDGEDE